jgi:hypothetical protein
MTHPALSAPADVIYFLGWITPRKNHTFAAFIRFIAGSGAYEELGLASRARRDEIAGILSRYLTKQDWRVLENAVSIPGGVSASAPVSYLDLPIVLWPSAETLHQMKRPRDGGPPRGYSA